LLGNGTGGFGAATAFAVGSGPRSVAVGDFDGNGKQDLAVANLGSSNVSILLGDGTGNFGAATDFGVGSFPPSLAVGDFTGDAKQDLAVANLISNDVSILLRRCPGLCKQEGRCFVFEYLGYSTDANNQTTFAFRVTNKCKGSVGWVAVGTDGFTRIAPGDGSAYAGSLGSYHVSWTRTTGNPGFVGMSFEPAFQTYKNGASDVFSVVVSGFNPATTIQVAGKAGSTNDTFSFLLSQTLCLL
jgi:hypothetical protein